MKKSLTTIKAQIDAIDAQAIADAKKLLAKVDRLKVQKKVAEAELKANKAVVIPVIKEISAAAQVKEIISYYADQITSGSMAAFLQKDFCKEFFNIRYALFIEVPKNASADNIKKLRFPDGDKNARYGVAKFTFVQIPNRTFLMTNDIYKKNVQLIMDQFFKFFK